MKAILSLTLLPTLLSAAVLTERAFDDSSSRQMTLSAGTGVHSFDYREYAGPNFKSTEKGTIPIFQGGLQYHSENRFIFGGTLDLGGANTTYDGSDQSGKIPVVGTTKNAIFNLEGTVSRNVMDPGGMVEILPYAGLGIHRWRRDLREASSIVQGYLENYTWIYLPLGASIGIRPTDRFMIALDASLRMNLGGSMQVSGMMAQTRTGEQVQLDASSCPLGAAMGYRLALPMLLGITPSVAMTLTPWYERVSIGEGDFGQFAYRGQSLGSNFSFREPPSDNDIFGAMVGVSFAL